MSPMQTRLDAERINNIVEDCILTEQEADAYGLTGGEVSTEDEQWATLKRLVKEGTVVSPRGVIRTYVFDPGRLEAYRAEVVEMLEDLEDTYQVSKGGGMTFLNMCMDRRGHQWTGLHLTMEQLCVLAIGLGVGAWPLPQAMWPMLHGGMPYFTWGSPEEIANIAAQADEIEAKHREMTETFRASQNDESGS